MFRQYSGILSNSNPTRSCHDLGVPKLGLGQRPYSVNKLVLSIETAIARLQRHLNCLIFSKSME